MKKMNRNTVLFYVIVILLVIGVLSRISHNPAAFVIPIIVLGGIFLLYKFPPKHWKLRHKRKSRFRVIEGKKKEGDNQPPPFH